MPGGGEGGNEGGPMGRCARADEGRTPDRRVDGDAWNMSRTS